jgi:hypothetical protein
LHSTWKNSYLRRKKWKLFNSIGIVEMSEKEKKKKKIIAAFVI